MLKREEVKQWKSDNVESIIIPPSVTEIESDCFNSRKTLTEVIFEEESNLEKIGQRAFQGSGLKTFKIPKSVETIGNSCFSKCENLSEVTIENDSNLEKIDANVFCIFWVD